MTIHPCHYCDDPEINRRVEALVDSVHLVWPFSGKLGTIGRMIDIIRAEHGDRAARRVSIPLH